MNDPVRLSLDGILVAVALVGVFVFIVFERPRLHVGLMLFIAVSWGVELSFLLAKSPRGAELYRAWHPWFSFSTTAAALAIILTRNRGRKP